MQTQPVISSNRRRHEEAPLSLLAYLMQGAGWLAFLLVLFWMAGLRF